MSKYPDDSIRVLGASVRMTASSTSTATALPLDAAGKSAQCVAVTALAAAYIRFATSAQAATTATSMLIAPNWPYLFTTIGYSHIAMITDSATTLVGIQAVEVG